METGTVKFFNPKKGYGFIAIEGSEKDILLAIFLIVKFWIPFVPIRSFETSSISICLFVKFMWQRYKS